MHAAEFVHGLCLLLSIAAEATSNLKCCQVVFQDFVPWVSPAREGNHFLASSSGTSIVACTISLAFQEPTCCLLLVALPLLQLRLNSWVLSFMLKHFVQAFLLCVLFMLEQAIMGNIIKLACCMLFFWNYLLHQFQSVADKWHFIALAWHSNFSWDCPMTRACHGEGPPRLLQSHATCKAIANFHSLMHMSKLLWSKGWWSRSCRWCANRSCSPLTLVWEHLLRATISLSQCSRRSSGGWQWHLDECQFGLGWSQLGLSSNEFRLWHSHTVLQLWIVGLTFWAHLLQLIVIFLHSCHRITDGRQKVSLLICLHCQQLHVCCCWSNLWVIAVAVTHDLTWPLVKKNCWMHVWVLGVIDACCCEVHLLHELAGNAEQVNDCNAVINGMTRFHWTISIVITQWQNCHITKCKITAEWHLETHALSFKCHQCFEVHHFGHSSFLRFLKSSQSSNFWQTATRILPLWLPTELAIKTFVWDHLCQNCEAASCHQNTWE